jgi:hypothetical protein
MPIENPPDGASLVVGSGHAGFSAAGAIWSFGPPGGDSMADVLRNGAPSGQRAYRLLWRGGVIFAQQFQGGWNRFDGNNWIVVPDVGPHQEPSGSPPVLPADPVCIVCGEPERRVIHGDSYCAEHGLADRNPAPPVIPCALDGCGLPAAEGLTWCRDHQRHFGDVAA